MTRLLTLLLVLFALGIAGGGAYLFVAGGQANGGWEQRGRQMATVEVTQVSLHPFADIIEALGTAQANESVVITSRVSETVASVHFDDGDMVEKDQVLVELSHAEQVAQLREARAALVQAQQQLERTRDLVERGNASRATLDEWVRRAEEARARIEAAEARISDRIIRAPFDGILGLRQVSPGALVSPGTTITTLDDVTPIKLDFAVPERFLSSLASGQTVLAKAAAYPGRAFRGEVATVSSRIDPVTRAVTVRAEVPNEEKKLRPGMLLTVQVVRRERESLALPEEAIVPIGDTQYVFVVNAENIAERRQVTLGERRPGVVEVLEGVDRGERVVVAGTQRVRAGEPVKVIGGESQRDEPRA